jgi:hypothetical protein
LPCRAGMVMVRKRKLVKCTVFGQENQPGRIFS